VSISVTVDDVTHLDAIVVELEALGEVAVERDRGIIAAVGAGMADDSQAIARLVAAIGGVPLHMASLSATGINFTVVVDDAHVVPVMERMHRAFFGAAA
jgi:aspartate kinase